MLTGHNFLPGLEYEYAESDFGSIYHYHDNYEIYFLNAGKNKYFLKDTIFSMNDNDIIFIEKGVLHKANYISKSYKRTFFNIYDDYLAPEVFDVLKSLCRQKIYAPPDPSHIKKLLSNINYEFEHHGAVSPALIKCYITELIVYCARNKSVYSGPDHKNPTIERVISYINHHYMNTITLADTASRFHLSEGYLSRSFKKNTGFAFKEYIIILRIKQAKELLAHTKKSVFCIASECGFKDSNYFSKIFHESTGMPPLQYRKTSN